MTAGDLAAIVEPGLFTGRAGRDAALKPAEGPCRRHWRGVLALDFGGTIAFEADQDGLHRARRRHGVTAAARWGVAPAPAGAAWEQAVRTMRTVERSGVPVSARWLVEEFQRILGVDPDPSDTDDLVGVVLSPPDHPQQLRPRASIATQLRRRCDLGLPPAGIISNTGPSEAAFNLDWLRKQELLRLLSPSGLLFSDAAGLGKPRRAVFATLAEAMGVRVDQMLVMGDDRELDVEAALRAGCAACLVDADAARPLPLCAACGGVTRYSPPRPRSDA
ncbi:MULTISPECIES: HAD family hydrolase [Micromonospora]|uniref:HAD family hydrolase n=1 Tax=Micromonospora TaxID=1873 RepID=UPI00064C3269|nr:MULTISPECIES: HAD family hydrolase [Micromonospora]MDG4750889.1 HAD family hydrolase [Micromonospora sp. WMMD718]UFN96868.1 HAD family hydrolase [Micromonospora aurantiaca]